MDRIEERYEQQIAALKESFRKEQALRCQCEFDRGECYSQCKYHGKMSDEIVALKEENIRLKEELECYKLRKQIAALKTEVEQLKFGRESLPCPRADK